MRLIATVLALLLQTSPQNQTGTIEGIVTRTGATGIPIAGAHVKVLDSLQTPAGRGTLFAETTTDGGGHFTVRDVPVGLYEIEIGHEAFGYRPARLDDAMFRSTVTVSPGQLVRVPVVSLAPAGAIYGRVLDADGKGVWSARVEVLRMTTDERGRKVWGAIPGRTFTDNQGAYRKTLFGSGDYYVRAVLESSAGPVTIYYPETMESSKAAPVIFSEGSEIAADIRIGGALTDESFQISGKVILPPVDVVSPFIELVLTQREPGGPIEISSTDYVRTSSRADEGIANFELRGLRPGDYELSATTRINGRSYTGKAPIDIRDRDMEGIELFVHPPVEVKGRLITDGEPQDVQLSSRATNMGLNGHAAQVILILSPTNRLPSDLRGLIAPTVDPTGKSFSFSEIPVGDYRMSARLITDGRGNQDLYIADIRAGGRSVIDGSFQVGLDVVDSMEVVVGTKAGSVEGRIAGSGSNLPAALVLIPETSRRSNPSLYRLIEVAADGRFLSVGIAPGKYKVFAVPYLNEPIPYRSAEFIDRHESRALSVTVQKGVTSGGLEVPLSLDK